MSTKISWTDDTWNPVRGCSRVSEGCRRCYAEVQAARIVRMSKGKPSPYDGLVKLVRGKPSPAQRVDLQAAASQMEPRWTGKVVLDDRKLAEPLSWRKPRRIFVNSMSDLFHENLTNEQIAAVFGVMAACPQHAFQVLTKRAKRMREWFAWAGSLGALDRIVCCADDALISAGWSHADRVRVLHPIGRTPLAAWPLPQVWIGVSVENQDAADERIPDLLQTPAAVRFLSCEPLLGPLDLSDVAPDSVFCCDALAGKSFYPIPSEWKKVDWLIAGCESGPGARPCDVEWLRSLRDQCAAAGVPFFLKQACAVPECIPAPDDAHPSSVTTCTASGQRWVDIVVDGDGSRRKPGGVIELPYLDGKQHAEFPR